VGAQKFGTRQRVSLHLLEERAWNGMFPLTLSWSNCVDAVAAVASHTFSEPRPATTATAERKTEPGE
jgi:hypothetical protein